MITEHSIFLLTFGDQTRRIHRCAMWASISYDETRLGRGAMARDLRILLAVLEEDGLTTWHRLRLTIASQLNQTWGPARAIWPVNGLFRQDPCTKIFFNRETDLNLPLSLKRYIKPQIRGKAFDLHISSSDFALSVYEAFQNVAAEMSFPVNQHRCLRRKETLVSGRMNCRASHKRVAPAEK